MKGIVRSLGLLVLVGAAAFSPPATAQSTTWAHCAKEGERCLASPGTTVRYGANGQFLSTVSKGNLTCGVSTFGGDPVHNVLKTCQYRLAIPAGWQLCAVEGQNCAAPAGTTVRYGANGTFINTVSNGNVPCGVAGFGHDPVPNVLKSCLVQSAAQTAGWQPCATEGQNCAAPAGATVRYGANGIYLNTTSNGNVLCGISGFGSDPVPNVLKSCQYRLATAGSAPGAPAPMAGNRPAAHVAGQPSSRDRCHDYANEMISMDQRARQTRCAGWNSHSRYDDHYAWCSSKPPASAEKALADWGTRSQTCAFAASGSPAAAAAVDPLGRQWNESEFGWSGTWKRVGKTNQFKATWTHPSGGYVEADLTMQVNADQVTIVRRDRVGPGTGTGCRYTGQLNGRNVSGTYTCDLAPGRTLNWSAEIN